MRLALAVLLAFALPAFAADLPAPARYAADYDTLLARWRAGRSADALALARDLTARSGDDAFLWHLRGDLAGEAGEIREAADAYRRAFQLGSATRAVIAEDMARAFARAGVKDSALTWLERSIGWGNENRPGLASDSAFAAWFSDPRFRTATGQLPNRAFTRDEGLRFDLATLVSEVKRMHYLYRVQPLPKSFENGVQALDERIPKLSDAQVLLAMQRLLAGLGDGHTTLYPVSERSGPWPMLPLRTYLFADGLFVVDADSAALVGRKVVAVEGTKADDAIAQLAPLVPKDNEQGVRWMGPTFLAMPDALVEAGIAPSAARVTFELEDPKGTRSKVTLVPRVASHQQHVSISRLAPPPGAAPARWLARAGEPYWFEPIGDSSIVYLQFNQVTNGKERLRDFAARLNAWVDARDPSDLVVDVRHNNGGNGNLNPVLERALIRFENGRPGRKLWVLTGRNTFSAAQSFINDLERLTTATFAGEPSSSSPNFIGESTSLRLPYSGAIGSVSTRFHSFRDADERTWIAPRVPYALSHSDWLANRDPALDAVVALAHARRASAGTPPPGGRPAP